MTMLRYEINKQKFPKFNSKDIEDYCNEIITYANNKEEFSKSLNAIIKKLDESKEDLSNTELTKSLDFVNKVMSNYPDWKKRK